MCHPSSNMKIIQIHEFVRGVLGDRCNPSRPLPSLARTRYSAIEKCDFRE